MTLAARSYTDSELGLLQCCVMNWRKANPNGTYCHSGDIAHRLYNGNRGVMPLSDIVRIYMQDDTIVGLLLCHPKHELIDLFIHPDYGSEHELILPILDEGYQIVHNYFIQHDKPDTAVFIECFPADTSRQQLLIKAEFREHGNEMNRTQCKLDNLPEIHLPKDFTIRSATLEDAEQLAEVHNRSFTSSWTTEVYRNEVMLKPGYAPEREFIIIAPDGTFAGFCVTWLDEINKVGLFEPVGIHEDYRQRGLGKALMIHAMHNMKAKGMVYTEVCYGVDNVPAQKLYTSLGFEIQHHIHDWKRVPIGGQ